MQELMKVREFNECHRKVQDNYWNHVHIEIIYHYNKRLGNFDDF